jgi:transcriptional regulator with XRE-family HTH domain
LTHDPSGPDPVRAALSKHPHDAGHSQQAPAAAAGVSRSLVAEIEAGRANPSLEVVSRLGDALGLELEILGRQPVVIGTRVRDAVHARCSGYTDRRLRTAVWQTAREVEVTGAGAHGWIDVLAFDPRTGALLIIEVKTRLDDIGAVERRLAWYERQAIRVARDLGWAPRSVSTWLLLLASDEVDASVGLYRDTLRIAFPRRATELRVDIAHPQNMSTGTRGLALIDPTSRRRDWLIPTRSDGRRTRLPYRDYADAARRLGSREPNEPARADRTDPRVRVG